MIEMYVNSDWKQQSNKGREQNLGKKKKRREKKK